ncbi:FkbM family methyltransferase [Roseivirga echinicomitans]
MKLSLRIKTLHRFWKFRLRSEKESIQYLLEHDLEGTTTLDIGANKGVYTYWMSRKVGANGKVFSFEPQPELGIFLNEVKESFKLKNITVVNKGLSSQPGEMNLYRRKVGDGRAMIESEHNKLFDPSGLEKVTVQVATLDDYLKDKNISKLSFIKCDVEGHELEVFKGGKETLIKHKPIILFECHHEEVLQGEVFRFLEELGYKGFFFDGAKKVDAHNFDTVPYPKSDNHRNYIFIGQ